MSRVLRFCLEVASLLKAMQEAGEPTTNIVTKPADRLWNASLQMLRDTKEHFDIYDGQASDDGGVYVDRCLNQLRSTDADASKLDAKALRSSFVDFRNVWTNDLESLRACVGVDRSDSSNRPSDGCVLQERICHAGTG
tara:strand:- start:112 stop:525 length:414 start_codon:yes stop_codon:yes gene_type:complete